MARASWPQHSHSQPVEGGVETGQQNAQIATYRGKGGVWTDFLREAIWRLREKFPLQHVTHAILTPFPALDMPPELDWTGWPHASLLYSADSQLLCVRNVWPAVSRLSGMQLPFLGLTAHLAVFTLYPRETDKEK